MYDNILNLLEEHNKKQKRHINALKVVKTDKDEQSDIRNNNTGSGYQFYDKVSKRDNNKKMNLIVGIFIIMDWVCNLLLSYIIYSVRTACNRKAIQTRIISKILFHT